MIRIFTDFDGTVTRRDVGDALFERFGGERSAAAVKEYRAGRISAAECFRRECEACGRVDPEEIHRFLDAIELDPTFSDFVVFCRSEHLPCTILSDGMDYYIEYILRRHRLADLPVRANALELVPADDTKSVRLKPHFPYRDEICDRCASCKRNHLLTMSADDDIIIYIGEGYSDRCPARFADRVFAKDTLRNYCREENISYYDYNSFSDITDRLRTMLRSRRPDGSIIGLTKRRRAELERRDVVAGG